MSACAGVPEQMEDVCKDGDMLLKSYSRGCSLPVPALSWRESSFLDSACKEVLLSVEVQRYCSHAPKTKATIENQGLAVFLSNKAKCSSGPTGNVVTALCTVFFRKLR